MAHLIKELVSGVVDSVLKEILKKTGVRTTSKRRRRQARTASGQFKRVVKAKGAKAPKKKVVRLRAPATDVST